VCVDSQLKIFATTFTFWSADYLEYDNVRTTRATRFALSRHFESAERQAMNDTGRRRTVMQFVSSVMILKGKFTIFWIKDNTNALEL